ncbi:MAG: hypothetical protein CVV27_11935 [Candidatus Melainabacteria bacterium HGW-Melainabacteria-1]|nr:MAG: hypothetical protein CVV27_11935 [Candidatus Melainabacteria bacterium HGW-Melainabacteria-1]
MRLNPQSQPEPASLRAAPAQTSAQVPAQASAPASAPSAEPRDQASLSRPGSLQPSQPLVDARPTAVSFPDRVASQTTDELRNINSRAVFFNANAATGEQIDAVLRHYNSPHAGQGDLLVEVCREQQINPVLLLAVMQQESSYGNRDNRPSLKDENIANPWSVHFNESAQGINKLRLKDGSLPSFEESLRGAIRTLKNLAGESETPLSTAGRRYSTTGAWTGEVTRHYEVQLNRIARMQ